MLFKKLSDQWAEKLCRISGETAPYKTSLVSNILEDILSTGLYITVLFLLAWLFGVVREALLIGIISLILKNFIGGLCLGTPLRCAVGGALIMVAVSYLSIVLPIAIIPQYLLLGILIALNFIIFLKAPLESPGKPLEKRQKTILRILSRTIIPLISAACFLWPRAFGINEMFYAMAFQTANLLKYMAYGMDKLERIFKKIERKQLF